MREANRSSRPGWPRCWPAWWRRRPSRGPPAWLTELATVPVAAQESDVEAVQLLTDVSLRVTPDGKLHRRVRSAFRLLRQSGENRAVLGVFYNTWSRVRDMQGWTIPARGKGYEARFRDAVDTAVAGVDDSTLVGDSRTMLLPIPVCTRATPSAMNTRWKRTACRWPMCSTSRTTIPVLQARYALELPAGWSMTSTWSNHAPVAPVQEKPQSWQWTLLEPAGRAVRVLHALLARRGRQSARGVFRAGQYATAGELAGHRRAGPHS